ncbi:hypothetical protein D4764_07G0006340 [Takifugu flavidus]|uniref:Uncharacterized protein n=1 Tax=Takifugu flavidus TaxID=433684 RepID=A0A5C6MSV7_9TELE|nr:hypothetical protein D4764_07G0006340 [Takifugu flavidus]
MALESSQRLGRQMGNKEEEEEGNTSQINSSGLLRDKAAVRNKPSPFTPTHPEIVAHTEVYLLNGKLPTAGVEAQWGSDRRSSCQSSPGLPHKTLAMGLMSPAPIDRSLWQVGW